MKKLVAAIAIAALTSITLAGSVAAMPGSGGGDQMPAPGGGKVDAPPSGGLPSKAVGGSFKVGSGAGGQSTGPGDAFYPGGNSGNARRDCLFAGGTPKSAQSDGNAIWLCL